MGNSGGKNRTHPLSEQERRSQPMMTMEPDFDHPRPPPAHGHHQDHGYPYDYDQRYDYDSGWHENRDYGQAYKYSRENPISKRSFTDCLCLLLFIAFLGGWGVVTFFAIQKGDISKVVYPTDTNGNICGRGALQDRKNLLMFDLTQCLNPAILVTGCQTTSICVKDCPSATYSPLLASKTPGSSEEVIKDTMKPYCNVIDDVNYTGLNVVNSSAFRRLRVQELIDKEVCPPWYLPSTALLGRCFPSFDTSAETRSSPSDDVVIPANDTIEGRDVTKKDLNTAVYRLGHFLSLQQFGERVFSDLKETWWMIGIALIGACVLSFVWIVLMRFLASIMVWTSIVIVFLGSGALLGFCGYKLYFSYLDTDPDAVKNVFQLNWTPAIVEDFLKQRDTWLAFTVITGIIFLVVVCVFIFLRQRILIAIALIEQGSRAVGHMCSSLFFPLVPWLLQVVVVGWALLVALYLASWGSQDYRVVIKSEKVAGDANPCAGYPECQMEFNSTLVPYHTNDTCNVQEFAPCQEKCPEASCQFVKYTHNQDYSWMQFTNLFGLYWGVFFFSAFGEMVLAGVFSQWYWTLDKKNDLPGCALGTAMYNATVFHLGTIAFGSLIISIIRMLRTILEYIEKKCKMYQNDLTKCLLCMCKCCLWCLEKFMRFINRNAYIVCAIKSTNFCKSALEAFNLIMRNLVRVVVLDSVVDFLLFLGKLVIVLITGATSYVAFAGQIPELKDQIPTLNYFFTPIVFITVGSYFIASAFFGVYAMAVDTLFLCFLEDLERNDGSMEKPYYMAKSLKQILGKMEKTAQENRRLRASYAHY